ncbi:MerR family DNA-binding protein [Sphingomonas sp. ASY06-1R]|jgi:Cu(I)-responsive transcriptional regulator|uniref:MerR family DNA-binding protein n=1 Tax=Sphingomonas sp. ASY06-1R TaxID=3445771 RepID=UPI003FA2B243
MKIGTAAAASGVSQRMIRHYEAIGLIPRPSRLDSNYRDYAPGDVNRLRFIANARDLGFATEEIAELLALWSDEGRASAEVKKLALARADALHAKARKLDAMRAALLELAGRCTGGDRPDCPIIDELSSG